MFLRDPPQYGKVRRRDLLSVAQAEHPKRRVALDGKSRDENLAATLSIEQLPGNPVILDEQGWAYCGSAGFLAACVSAATKDFFVPPSASREAKFDIARARLANV